LARRERQSTAALGHSCVVVCSTDECGMGRRYGDSLYQVHDEAKDKEFELELSWVCEESNRMHTKVPAELQAEAEAFAKQALEDNDMDD